MYKHTMYMYLFPLHDVACSWSNISRSKLDDVIITVAVCVCVASHTLHIITSSLYYLLIISDVVMYCGILSSRRRGGGRGRWWLISWLSNLPCYFYNLCLKPCPHPEITCIHFFSHLHHTEKLIHTTHTQRHTQTDRQTPTAYNPSLTHSSLSLPPTPLSCDRRSINIIHIQWCNIDEHIQTDTSTKLTKIHVVNSFLLEFHRTCTLYALSTVSTDCTCSNIVGLHSCSCMLAFCILLALQAALHVDKAWLTVIQFSRTFPSR